MPGNGVSDRKLSLNMMNAMLLVSTVHADIAEADAPKSLEVTLAILPTIDSPAAVYHGVCAYKNTQHYQYYPHNIVYGISANHMVYLWPLRAAISASKRQNWGDAGFVF